MYTTSFQAYKIDINDATTISQTYRVYKGKSGIKEFYELQIKTLREDFEQEREDRRRAHEKIETLREEVEILRVQLQRALKSKQ